MINKEEFSMKEGLEALKEILGTVEDLKKENNKTDTIDSIEEIMKLYIQYLRDGIIGEWIKNDTTKTT